MLIENLFEKDIFRPINGVVKAVDSQQDSPVDSHEHSTPGQRSRSCVTC
jgi:hypothetical protein